MAHVAGEMKDFVETDTKLARSNPQDSMTQDLTLKTVSLKTVPHKTNRNETYCIPLVPSIYM